MTLGTFQLLQISLGGGELKKKKRPSLTSNLDRSFPIWRMGQGIFLSRRRFYVCMCMYTHMNTYVCVYIHIYIIYIYVKAKPL